MPTYTCPRCLKEFKQKGHLQSHSKRKNPCQEIGIKKELENIKDDIHNLKLKIETNPKVPVEKTNYMENLCKEVNKIKIEDSKKKLIGIELFSGCGGMAGGLERAGINVLRGIDIWDKAIESYNKNFNNKGYCADLTKFPPDEFEKMFNPEHKEIDILTGGPPCQSYSIAGKRDKNDPRNSLFMEFVKYLNFFKPRAFIMENVVGILSKKTSDGENVIDIIMNQLNTHYRCIITKLYASDFEVPQNRRRVIIIGIRNDLNIEPTEPEAIIKRVQDRIAVKTVLLKKNEIEKSYYLSERAIQGIANKKAKSKERGAGFGAQFLDMEKPSYTIPARYWKDGYDALVRYSDTEIRRLTVLELKRIQTFPDDFVLCGSKKDQIMQIGNAVATTFAYHIANHIKSILP